MAHREAGFTLLEVFIALAVLTLALLVHASLVGTLSHQARGTRNLLRAVGGAEACLEGIRSHDFASCFAAFDENTANDPEVAPGPHFDVPGLEPSPDDPDGRVGRILFPTALPSAASWDEGTSPASVLREDLTLPELGMPMDLDGDGLLDADAKDDGYVRLPVLVEVRWRERGGERVFRMRTVLTP